MTDYMRVKEVAAQLSVSEQTVRKLLRAGELQSIRIGKRAVRITRGSVDAYLWRYTPL